MAANSTIKDKYANVLYDAVEESAANTLTFESVDVGLNIFDKVGLLISRIEYTNWGTLLDADGDTIQFGLSTANSITTINPSESSIIDYNKEFVEEYGAAANALLIDDTLLKDFSTLPGGGLLITPKPLYLYVQGSALASAATVRARLFFTVIPLKPEEYFELLEARQYFG